MKPNLQFDFIADKDNSAITIRREFAAGRQLVWDCYTKAELLNRWFAPKPFTTRTKSMEFREGGHWHYAMIDPEGSEYWGYTQYKTITPISAYTSRDGFSDETGAINKELPQADWDVAFNDMGDRTMVQTVVQYASLEALETVIQMGMEEGMASTLERLDELLEDVKAKA